MTGNKLQVCDLGCVDQECGRPAGVPTLQVSDSFFEARNNSFLIQTTADENLVRHSAGTELCAYLGPRLSFLTYSLFSFWAVPH